MKILLMHFCRSAIDWLFRRRSPALLLMRFGVGCLALAFGASWILDVSFPFRGGQVEVGLNSAGGTPAIIVYMAATVGVVLIAIGLVWEIIRYRAEQRRLARTKVIVVEARGLRDSSGAPLIDALPARLEGYRDHVLVDLRQRINDGEIVAPETALQDLESLSTDLKRREHGFDRRDISIAYGGLTPVPLTFLTGVLMDDEGVVVILDWDRHTEAWRELDGTDDGKRFQISCPAVALQQDANEIALIVSVSYEIFADDVRTRVGDMPIVQLKLDDGSPDCHWSEEKQRALGRQFLDTAIALSNHGIKRIHLFLAAQNSVAFRFGRLYDKRNLPEVIVYQYQRHATPPYPWGVLMPVCGIGRPAIVRD